MVVEQGNTWSSSQNNQQNAWNLNNNGTLNNNNKNNSNVVLAVFEVYGYDLQGLLRGDMERVFRLQAQKENFHCVCGV